VTAQAHTKAVINDGQERRSAGVAAQGKNVRRGDMITEQQMKERFIGSLHTLYEFCWSDIADKCVQPTPEQIENLEHLCRDLLDPIECYWGRVERIHALRDQNVYRLLLERHEKFPRLFSKPSQNSHHFAGNAVDFKHLKLEKIFEWIRDEGLPTRELRLYKSHIHIAQLPFHMKRIKDCR
jgi:hypothetical protein